MSNIIVSLIIIFFLTGCQTTSNLHSNKSFSSFDEFYIKKDKAFLVWYPELDNLEEKISKWEYRKLPSYLQDCYEKTGDN